MWLSFSGGTISEMDDWRETARRELEPYVGNVIDTIVVSGNDHTRRKAIVREMATRPGEPLDHDRIVRDTSWLWGLGWFTEVNIRAEVCEAGRCRVLVHVEERPGLFMKYPYPVVNYDIDDGVTYGVKWKVKNFRGLGEQLSFSATRHNEKEYGGSVSWSMPWAFGRRFQLRSSVFNYRRLEEPSGDDYIKARTGAELVVGVPVTDDLIRQFWLFASLSYEVRESVFDMASWTDGYNGRPYRQNLYSIGAALSFDSRDNRIAPRRGTVQYASIRRYEALHGVDQQYSFYKAASYYYIPAGPVGTFIIAANGDFRDGDVPPFFEIGLGGRNDLRGYTDPPGSRRRARLLGTIQLRHKLLGPRIFSIPRIGRFDLTVNGVIFADNGALMRDIGDIERTTFTTSGGFGFEILSPVQDLIRIEAAFCEGNTPHYYVTSGLRF